MWRFIQESHCLCKENNFYKISFMHFIHFAGTPVDITAFQPKRPPWNDIFINLISSYLHIVALRVSK